MAYILCVGYFVIRAKHPLELKGQVIWGLSLSGRYLPQSATQPQNYDQSESKKTHVMSFLIWIMYMTLYKKVIQTHPNKLSPKTSEYLLVFLTFKLIWLISFTVRIVYSNSSAGMHRTANTSSNEIMILLVVWEDGLRRGKQSGGTLAGKWADAGMCEYPSCFLKALRCAI
jgi:hypothetical protein